MPAWSRASAPSTADFRTVLTCSTALSTPLPRYRFLSPSRSSTASRVPVEAPEGTAARPMAPESRMTSASTVGLPRESMISRPRMAAIRLMSVGPGWLGNGRERYAKGARAARARDRGRTLKQGFLEGLGLDGYVQGLERFQEWLHAAEGPRVWAVGKGLGGVGVRFHEETGDAGGDGCASEDGNELPLAA